MRRSDPFGPGAGLPRLRRGLRVDHLGDERLVLDTASGVVHTVRGPAVAELDRVLTGRAGLDDEVLAALVASGVVEVLGVGRRQALALSGTAALLISTTLLPSATAAASVGGSQVPSPEGIVSQFSVSNDDESAYYLYRVAHTSEATSVGDLTRSITAGFAGQVELLLIGGGGGGGTIPIGDTTNVGGGGGAGEVHQIQLDFVPAGTVLTVVVGGQSLAGSNGQPTYVKIDDVVVGLAQGGGRGAGAASAAGDGGSGGGGSSAFPSGGSAGEYGAVGEGASSYGFASLQYDGGGGLAGRGGGGGGAGFQPDPSGSEGYGAAGGGSVDVNEFFFNYSTGSSPHPGEYRYVAAGGGGGGSIGGRQGGLGGDDPIGGFGADPGGPSVPDRDPLSMNGLFATGSGGGGGAASADTAYGGRGASGVAWVMISAA